MNQEQLAKHFAAMGARVRFRQLEQRSRSSWDDSEPPKFTIDIQRDRKGEFFDFAMGPEAPEFKLLQTKPKDRHLLLLTNDGQRFLCGHDERHWFVSGVEKTVSNVRDAKQALLPDEIWEQLKNLPPDEVDNRRNAVFKRQGEWYFVPSQREIPDHLVLKDEPLQRTAVSKPHVCQELYREGGELVYIVGREQMTEEEYTERKAEDPDFDRIGLRTMVRNPIVYARRYVRHDDHATIKLDSWHRVFINAEVTGSETIQFLD